MLESRKTKPKKLKITILTISIVGLLLLISRVSFGFWKINVEQVRENIVTSDCFKLNFKETKNTDISLTDAYPLSKSEREELLKTSVPYQFEITNVCDNYASATINMETIKPEEEKILQDKWVDVILLNQEQNMEEELDILSSADYKLVSNPESDKKVIEEATKAYELYTFTLRGKETRAFKLYIFMDEETEAKDENMNAAWEGKVTVSLESARMYYVAESGNDETGNGSYGNPYKSIQKAYEEVPSGGVISLLSDLNQSEEIELNEEEKEVIITSHLTSEKRIYEIKREESLKDQAVMHITNKNKVSLANIKVNGEEIEANKSLIEVENATLNLEEASAIENGKTTQNGGGITVNNSTLNINGGSVSKNTASLGGGIFASGTGTINLNSGNINENTSNYGGGIEIYGIIAFTMNGGNIKGNKVTTSDSNGGGIYINSNGKDGAIFEMTGGNIEENISAKSGAGIGISQNCGEIDIKINGGEFLNNQASKYGGAIIIGNNKKTKVQISGGEFKNNSSGENGGAITLTSEKAGTSTNEITGGLFENNTSSSGGGIFIYSTEPNVMKTKISNVTLINNHANYGGGIYIYSSIDNLNFEIENALIENNNATLSDTTGIGGGIRFTGNKTNTLTLINTIIANNESRDGGGIYSSGKLILESGKIDGNRSKRSGGGIMLADNNVEFEMNGGEITKNTAGTFGGGISIVDSVKANSIFAFNGGLIAYNTATTRGGGLGYYNAEESTINLNGTDFIGNTAGTYGGGIDILTNKKIHYKMNQGKVEENTAISGGGIYFYDQSIGTNNIYNINGGSISKNVAKRPSETDGGGVGGGIRFYVQNDENITLNLKNVEINNNEAGNCGGGIYSGALGKGILNINEKTKISSNSTLQSGGGIFLDHGILYLKGGIIENNTAAIQSGGIYINTNTKFYMSGGSIINNTCTGTETGGLYVHPNATEYKKTGGVIDGNLPTNVGGLALN